MSLDGVHSYLVARSFTTHEECKNTKTKDEPRSEKYKENEFQSKLDWISLFEKYSDFDAILLFNFAYLYSLYVIIDALNM